MQHLLPARVHSVHQGAKMFSEKFFEENIGQPSKKTYKIVYQNGEEEEIKARAAFPENGFYLFVDRDIIAARNADDVFSVDKMN